jgi:molybdopterin molybdotransferase
VRSGAPEGDALNDVLGCATSVPLDAPEDVPPFDNTAMDGYAVRALDTVSASPATPVRLEVAGLLPASGSHVRGRPVARCGS